MTTSRTSELAGRRILLMNWRDLTHPQAGGAELYCQEIGERLAAAGVEVHLVTAAHPDAPVAELVRGVQLHRSGGTFGVYGQSALHLLRHRRHYDAVVDFQNGIPFFAPVFAARGTAVVCVIHHVHQEQFALHYPPRVARLGRLLEGPVSRRIYGRRPIVVVSASTRAQVRRLLGFTGPIHIVPNGVAVRDAPSVRRSATPIIACVTRLVPQKRLHLLIDMLPGLRARWPELHVDIAGTGPSQDALAAQVEQAGLGDVVTLHGRVSDERRNELLARAWLTVSPSVAEGWGLSIVEANALGLPSCAFAVPGLRDSIRHGATGWLTPEGGDLQSSVLQALEQLADPARAARIASACRAWAARFTWEQSTERLAAVLVTEIARSRRGRSRRRTTTDLAVKVELDVPDVDRARVAQLLLTGLRRTDSWQEDVTGFRLLLHGLDEAEAQDFVLRLGLPAPRSLSVARPSELITAI